MSFSFNSKEQRLIYCSKQGLLSTVKSFCKSSVNLQGIRQEAMDLALTAAAQSAEAKVHKGLSADKEWQIVEAIATLRWAYAEKPSQEAIGFALTAAVNAAEANEIKKVSAKPEWQLVETLATLGETKAEQPSQTAMEYAFTKLVDRQKWEICGHICNTSFTKQPSRKNVLTDKFIHGLIVSKLKEPVVDEANDNNKWENVIQIYNSAVPILGQSVQENVVKFIIALPSNNPLSKSDIMDFFAQAAIEKQWSIVYDFLQVDNDDQLSPIFDEYPLVADYPVKLAAITFKDWNRVQEIIKIRPPTSHTSNELLLLATKSNALNVVKELFNLPADNQPRFQDVNDALQLAKKEKNKKLTQYLTFEKICYQQPTLQGAMEALLKDYAEGVSGLKNTLFHSDDIKNVKKALHDIKTDQKKTNSSSPERKEATVCSDALDNLYNTVQNKGLLARIDYLKECQENRYKKHATPKADLETDISHQTESKMEI